MNNIFYYDIIKISCEPVSFSGKILYFTTEVDRVAENFGLIITKHSVITASLNFHLVLCIYIIIRINQSSLFPGQHVQE